MVERILLCQHVEPLFFLSKGSLQGNKDHGIESKDNNLCNGERKEFGVLGTGD